MTAEPYRLEDHRHRFALWAAARAAQRSLAGATNAVLANAIETSGVLETLRSRPTSWPENAAEFDREHGVWCTKIVQHLRGKRVDATFGRAAKLVAIYLKTVIVLGESHNTPLSRFLHPPIDDILLKELSRPEHNFSEKARRHWKSVRWTQLDKDGYGQLIKSLRGEGLHRPAFWMAERYWDGTR
jgi:hypothetical protein